MHWLWPKFVFLLGAMPVIVAIYIWVLRRRKRFAVRYSSLALVREANPHHKSARRHIPFALLLLALASLVLAISRPYAVILVPTDQTTVILALDVSRSMCSTDIKPSRLQSAEAAALSFVRRLKARTQIGVVAFSGFTELVQAPTTNPELLQNAIESLTLGSTTAVGSGILESLEAIAKIHPDLMPAMIQQSSDMPVFGQRAVAPQGAYVPAIIILLTDGVSNTGPDPLEVAQLAADRGVRVFTIGFGTADGALYPECSQQGQGNQPNEGVPFIMQFGGEAHGTSAEFRDNEIHFRRYSGDGGNGGAGSGFPRGIDEATLEQIAAMTDGAYYPAQSASELEKVYKELSTQLITQREKNELSVAFAAIGAFLTAMAVMLSMRWNPLG